MSREYRHRDLGSCHVPEGPSQVGTEYTYMYKGIHLESKLQHIGT